MPTINMYTKEYLDTILENAIVGAHLTGDDLILELEGGAEINVGSVRGGPGAVGPAGSVDTVNGMAGPAVTIPDGTNTVKGLVELATVAEAVLAMATDKAITPAGLGAFKAELSAGYRLVETQYLNVTGPFVKATYPWLRAIRVRAIGGGGGSAGSNTTAAAQASIGGSGGGGSLAEAFIINIAGLAASVDVTRGAGGTAGAAGANGGAGGTSSFGTLVVAGGGAAGTAGPVAAANIATAFSPAAIGGVASVGDVLVNGEGSESSTYGATTVVVPGRPGIAPVFSSRARQVATVGAVGYPSFGYGAGAYGAANGASQAARAGAAGTDGVVILDLFA